MLGLPTSHLNLTSEQCTKTPFHSSATTLSHASFLPRTTAQDSHKRVIAPNPLQKKKRAEALLISHRFSAEPLFLAMDHDSFRLICIGELLSYWLLATG